MTSMRDGKKTPLYEAHRTLGAKMLPFGGWLMPVSYKGVLEEHRQVRNGSGLFDVSHMGELRVKGTGAEAFLQQATINDLDRLSDGKGQYTALLNKHGGVIDDLILYRLKSDDYLLCVNASNIEKDYLWLAGLLKDRQTTGSGMTGEAAVTGDDVTLSNDSSDWAQLAVQGPKTKEALEAVFDSDTLSALQGLTYMGICNGRFEDRELLIARTGYTGEFGFELYLPSELAPGLWSTLLKKSHGQLAPIGLGARDTLRLEACYLLYGNDMNESVTPLEAGIGWATRLDKEYFVGKEALQQQKTSGVPRRLVAFRLEEAGIPRQGMTVFKDDTSVGTVTSGSVLPSLGGAGGLALVRSEVSTVDTELRVDIRGKRKLARVVKKPLYSARVNQ